MHPNPVFRRAPRASALDLARERGFGTFTVAGPEGVLAAHAPFVLDEGRVLAHLVRANPIARHLGNGPARALLIVSGPDGYVSPDWYGEPQLVPTWNYVAVHLRGAVRLLDDTALRPILDRLSHTFETRLAPKPVRALKHTPPKPAAGRRKKAATKKRGPDGNGQVPLL